MDKINKLVEWAKTDGAGISDNIEFTQFDKSNFGAKSTNTSKASIQIPRKLIITCDLAKSLFGEKVCNESKNHGALLKLYLCYERLHSNSFYKPYFDILPDLQEIGSPYTWSPEEKSYIQGTNLGNSLNENLQALIEEWWSVINLLPESINKPEEHFINMKFYYEYKFYKDQDFFDYFNNSNPQNWTSFPNYLWSSLIFKSRSFPTYIIDKTVPKNESMLLPVVDMLNHNPKAKVQWTCNNESFVFETDSVIPNGEEIFNNYGMKGNEELLLAYGFAIENNVADSVALKIKVPESSLKILKELDVKLPTIDDYTNSIVGETESNKENYENGILFFINSDNIPENLIQVFQVLVQNPWEKGEITLRMKFAGLNHLRAALEVKKNMLRLDVPIVKSLRYNYIKWYVDSQNKIFTSAIKDIKRQEKQLLTESKSNLITLKNVYKKDTRFQQSLLFLGFDSYEKILESEFQDQCWLLWLIRCYNKNLYKSNEELPDWIFKLFKHLRETIDITGQEVLNYKPVFDAIIPDLASAVPEIYDTGEWTIGEFIIAGKLLDLISFTRGKEQECIVVKQNYKV
ncbi:uncharacterized protein KGF55_005444 [Candida pseudojiufengensis]|uniref:uncharacterized protein n=1 Tax=Candida pseudojiufengensis TaxID=497109 RepID=UPI002224D269|nr:uncharacterized protein KGF55_005444 [Candida pseudojiufengensis]KAI5959294.1 hypothetical protein KGF55_005444 [Candida pseudojiufengensis]